jgi:LuxR family maltose regulon positive regulatory protein
MPASRASTGEPPGRLTGEVERPRLVRRLNAAVRGALTLVVAPPGYGKTTAVAQWARTQPAPVAWVRCDRTRDDVLADVSSALTAPASPAYVVLDRIGALAPDVREHLGRLVADDGAQRHWIIASRSQRVLPETVARLRARDAAAFLSAEELAFDRDELRDYVTQALGTDIGIDTLTALYERTQGWIAAVRMAVAAARDSGNPTEALTQFDGTDPSLREYCRAEFVNELPAETRSFALTIAVVEGVTADLAARITGRDDSAAVLELLTDHGIVHRDRRAHEQFRCPPLLRSVFAAEFDAQYPGRRSATLDAAANWHAEQGTVRDLDVAGRYLLAANRWPELARLAAAYGQWLHQRGETPLPVSWLQAIPAELRRPVPVCLLEAGLLTCAGDTIAASDALRRLEAGDQELPAGVRADIDLITAVWAQGHLAPQGGLQAARRAHDAFERLARDEFVSIDGLITIASAKTLSRVMEARSLWYLDDVAGAMALVDVEAETGDPSPLGRLHVLCAVAELEASYGSLHRAERSAAEARHVGAQSHTLDHPLLVAAELALAHVCTERGDYQQAKLLLDRADELTRTMTFEVWTYLRTIERAWLALALDEPRTGLALLDEAPPTTSRPRLDARWRALGARLLLAAGEPRAAQHRLRYDEEPVPDECAAAVQLALAAGDLRSADDVMRRWPEARTYQDDLARRWWAAVVDHAGGNVADAVTVGESVVHDAAHEYHARLFLDGGAPSQQLLAALSRADPTGYASVLLRGENARRAAEYGGASLSPRERAVLELLAERLTYAEIGERLFISTNTVSTHAKNAYMKLGATSRKDAVQRAGELGLL